MNRDAHQRNDGAARGLHEHAPRAHVQRGLYLRLPTLEDGPEFLALRRASREFHAPWEADLPAGLDPCDEAAFLRFLEVGDPHKRQRLFLCRKSDHAILGSFSLSNINRGILQTAQLGYWIGLPHARQGYMRAGLPLLVRHAFGTLKLHRLEACIQLDNEASRKLLIGAGFQLEGVARGFARLRGKWVDHERWALLATDRRIRRRSGAG